MSIPKKNESKKSESTGALERAVPLNMALMQSHRQCPAMSRRTGEQCKNYCSLGMRTCRFHGSATRKAKTAAATRIAQASGYAADMLAEFMADPGVELKIRVQVAQDLLSRAGINGTQKVEVTTRTWEDVLEGVLVDVEDPNFEDAVIIQYDPDFEVRRDEELRQREAERTARQRKGGSGAPAPSEQRARDRAAEATQAFNSEKEAFLLKRLADPPKKAAQPIRRARRP